MYKYLQAMCLSLCTNIIIIITRSFNEFVKIFGTEFKKKIIVFRIMIKKLFSKKSKRMNLKGKHVGVTNSILKCKLAMIQLSFRFCYKGKKINICAKNQGQGQITLLILNVD